MTTDTDRHAGDGPDSRRRSSERLVERRRAARERSRGPGPSDGTGIGTAPRTKPAGEGSGAVRTATTHRTAGEPRTRRRHWVRWTLALVLLVVLGAGVFGCVALNDMSRRLPDLGDVNAVATFQTTRIYDASKPPRIIASLAGEGNRTVIPDDQINKLTRQAVVAIEDRRFYSHPAVDVWGIIRALWINVVRRSVVQGGSTITQQYVKNAYFSQRRTLERKLKEALLAYRLEKKYTKDQILALYLNTIYFGAGAYGVEAAAQTYFGKHARQMKLAEAAMLAGLIRSPARYSPFNHPEAAKGRRSVVLAHMVQEGYITAAQAEAADKAPLPKARSVVMKSAVAPYFVDHVTQRLVETVGERAAFSGGLRVYTTLDLGLQEEAEKIIDEELDRPKDPSASLLALDPRTGAVRVMVGGRDYRQQQYNVATQGHRQPGSSFKTFVLAAGVSRGVSPDQYFDSDSPVTFEVTGAPDWKVNNYEGHGSGWIPLTDATARSVNAAYANLMMKIGAPAVADTARRMGISSPINKDPAIALGGLKQGVNPLEMAAAYGTLADQGVYNPPYTIEKILDAEGDRVRIARPARRKALEPAAAYLVTQTLEDVVDWGTGTRADIGRPQAGKTGTTQNYADAWFVGFVPQMSTAVWVGYPTGQVPMRDVHGIRVTGGSFPAAIWAQFMEKALAGDREQDFADPPDGSIVTREIDPVSGYLATAYCPNVVEARYPKGLAPEKECPVHEELLVPKVVGLSFEQARDKLHELGLEATATAIGSGAPRGRVLAQTPAAGAKAKRGQVVRLTVSGGPDAPGSQDSTQAIVPDVVGLSLDKAEAALAQAGFKASVTYETSAKPRDQVLAQKPDGGVLLSRGYRVALTVSGGDGVATVPAVVGLSRDAATARLDGAGFTAAVETASKEESRGHRPGTVVRQSPSGGSQAPPRSTVVIYVAEKG